MAREATGAGPTAPHGLARPQYGDPGTLWRSDGSPVTDLDAYGPDGRPTYGVTIVDQDGTPYEVGPDPARPTIPRDFWPNPDGTWGAAEGQQTPTTPLDPSAPDPSTTATTVPAS